MITHADQSFTLDGDETVIHQWWLEQLDLGKSITQASLDALRGWIADNRRRPTPSPEFVAWLTESTVRLTRHGVPVRTPKGRRYP